MAFKLGSMLLVALIALVALVGCDTARDMVMDTMSATDTEMDDMMDMMPPMDTEMMADAAPDMEAIPVKLVWLINYPVGGKADYIAWIATVAPTLQAPEELKRVASYDNVRGENPHRLVEFDADAAISDGYRLRFSQHFQITAVRRVAIPVKLVWLLIVNYPVGWESRLYCMDCNCCTDTNQTPDRAQTG